MFHFPSACLRRRLYFRSAVSLFLFFCVASLFISAPSGVHAATHDQVEQQYNEFWSQDTYQNFQSWTLNGVSVRPGLASPQIRLSSRANLSCQSADIDGGATSYNAGVGLCAGTDPMAPGSYNGGLNYYNGGSFYYGTLLSPVHVTRQPVTTIISSWNANTPDGTWMEVHVRILEDGSWTHWYDLPIWASDFSTINRHSVDGQWDNYGGVATDTFYAQTTATAYQISITLFTTTPSVSPVLYRFGVIADYDNSDSVPAIAPDKSAWGINLPVPQRSQMLSQYEGLGYGGGGEVWCSPTSTSMVMAYWSNILRQSNLNQTVPDAAEGTYDFTYEGTGNWPFNTAYATQFGNMRAFVTRMYSMSQIEQWVKFGVPIVISVAYGPGELPGSPIPSTDGHLLLVRGFTSNGDVITNDPAAATDAAVQIIYPRAALQKVWLDASNGTVYVIYPQFWPTPVRDRDGSW